MRPGTGPEAPGAGTSSDPGDRVAVVVPALDEAANVRGLVEELAQAGLRRIVIVDNGSTDGTARVARDAGAHVVQEGRRGYGSACRRGLAELGASSARPEVVLFVDADRSDDPGAFRCIWGPVLEGRADLVIGCRRGAADAPVRQRLGTRLVTRAARIVHRVELSDLGPLRAIAWTALDRLEMDDRDWGWTLQMQLRAHRAGLRVLEVPVKRRPRAAGFSKISGNLHMSIHVGIRMFRTLWQERNWRPREG